MIDCRLHPTNGGRLVISAKEKTKVWYCMSTISGRLFDLKKDTRIRCV